MRLHIRNARAAFVQSAKALTRRRFTRFLMVGAGNTVFGYAVFFAVLWAVGDAIVAALVSTIAGVLFNFRTTGALVFRSHDPSLLTRFIAVYAALFAVNAAALRAFEYLGASPALTQAGLLPILAGLSYVLNRDLVFAKASKAQTPA